MVRPSVSAKSKVRRSTTPRRPRSYLPLKCGEKRSKLLKRELICTSPSSIGLIS